MDEGEAFAIATQQAHALGKTPQGYGTSEGRRTAKRKYRSPSEYQKTAEAQMWLAFFDELEKTAGPFTPLARAASGFGSSFKNGLTGVMSGTQKLMNKGVQSVRGAFPRAMPGHGVAATPVNPIPGATVPSTVPSKPGM
jgi:hypothetical protein